MGSDLEQAIKERDEARFQSTLPVWGATVLRGGLLMGRKISIHAPRVGSDGNPITPWSWTRKFQSTLPVWGATGEWLPWLNERVISIHAPRVGSDQSISLRAFTMEISIHAPRVGSD